jgi:hypothetical protein
MPALVLLPVALDKLGLAEMSLRTAPGTPLPADGGRRGIECMLAHRNAGVGGDRRRAWCRPAWPLAHKGARPLRTSQCANPAPTRRGLAAEAVSAARYAECKATSSSSLHDDQQRHSPRVGAQSRRSSRDTSAATISDPTMAAARRGQRGAQPAAPAAEPSRQS